MTPTTIPGLKGEFASPLQTATWSERIRAAIDTGHPDGRQIVGGRNQLYRVETETGPVAWKVFGRESALKNRVDAARGSKAERSHRVAARLQAHGVGTPTPLGWFDVWEGRRLRQAHYLCHYEDGLSSFKDELLHRLQAAPPTCPELIQLLQTVATAVRAMHEAGVAHFDLGNQNILIRRTTDGGWDDVQFIDLNRARLFDGPAPHNARGRDLSRITLPSDLRRVFFAMVFEPSTIPPTFTSAERLARTLFDLHTRSRGLRHPIRTRRFPPVPVYPPDRDLYIWDPQSVQAIPALRSRDRRKHLPLRSHLHVVRSSVQHLPPLRAAQRKLVRQAFGAPVKMAGRIGLLDEAGRVPADIPDVPLLLRFYHHETEPQWEDGLAQLASLPKPAAISLVQCRRSVTEPSSWRAFTQRILTDPRTARAPFVEVAHAINRSKWGIWTMEDYGRLLANLPPPTFQSLAGPAVIDWELHYLAAALDTAEKHLPQGRRFSALSHHMYVDRRGAPENRQSGFDLVGKLAGLRAAARMSTACDDRVIVSEVNWPLRGTGAWSPVTSPYETAGPRFGDPSVDEATYAKYMLRYLLLAICSGMADEVYWWKLDAKGFGLRDGARVPRPAYHVFVHLLATLGSATFQERLPSDDDVWLLRFDCELTVAWTTGVPRKIPVAFERATDMQGHELAEPMLSDDPLYLHG